MRFLFTLVLLLTLHGHCLAARALDLTSEERAWLAAHKDSLVLSYDRSFPPIEFENPDGSFSGLSAELVAQLEARLGITFRKQGLPWNAALQGLQDGSTALAPAIVNTPERSQYTIFTPPYVSIPHVIVTSRSVQGALSLDDLAGMRVAVVRGYASADLVCKANKGRYVVVEVESIREGLRDVSFGVVDAFVESLVVAAWYIEQEGLPNLRVAGDLDVTQELSIGVSRHYPLLASAVTKTLASLPESGKKSIVNRWIQLPSTFIDTQTRNRLTLAALFSVVALLVLAGLAWILSRKLRKKVTELKLAQAALTDQLGRFRLALEATQAGFWEHFPAEGREEHSPEWFAMLGHAPQSGGQGLDSWTNLIHPADRDRAVDTFAAYIRDGGHGLYEAEYRMRAGDGTWRWVLGKGRAVAWDDKGQPSRIIGLNMDIHKSRQAQEEMNRFQAMNRALLEQTSQFIGLVSLKGVLLVSNRTALEWARAREEDVIGKPFWEGPWWPDKAKAEAMLRKVLEQVRAGATVRQEITHFSPEGHEVVFDFTASPFRDDKGQVVSFIVEGRDISDLKKKQTAIMESEKRFRTIFENAPYSMSINRLSDGRYMDANTAFLDKMGIRREELLGLTPLEVGAFPDEHREEIFLALRHNRNVHNLETRVHRPDGKVGHILYSGGLITLGGVSCILSMTVDITELKNAQEALRRSKEMFHRLFQLSPDMVTLARLEDGTLLEMNEAFTRTLGYSREEALGRSTLDLGIFVEPSRRAELIHILRRDGQAENFEYDIRHRDGHILHCSTSAKAMTIDGMRCLLAITRDMTHVRAMQEAMIQSEKMLSLGGIAAGIAHEINNPLGIVLQAIQTINLRTRPDFPKNLEAAAKIGVDLHQLDRYLKERKIDIFIRDIQGAAVRAAEIIRHMLNFSRRSESRRSACNITAIVEQALRLASSDYDLKKNYDFKAIEIIKDFASDLPAFECTETEIEQVLLNLLRNAAQAMAETSPPTPSPRIRISVRPLDKGLRIDIADNGPGISQENRKRIFEPFFTTKAPGEGTGLGLSVSYFIVTSNHKGSFTLESEPGHGAEFIIRLPVDTAQPAPRIG